MMDKYSNSFLAKMLQAIRLQGVFGKPLRFKYNVVKKKRNGKKYRVKKRYLMATSKKSYLEKQHFGTFSPVKRVF